MIVVVSTRKTEVWYKNDGNRDIKDWWKAMKTNPTIKMMIPNSVRKNLTKGLIMVNRPIKPDHHTSKSNEAKKQHKHRELKWQVLI